MKFNCKKFAQWRKMKFKSRADFAKLLGKSTPLVQKWENGRGAAIPSDWKNIANALRCKIEDFCDIEAEDVDIGGVGEEEKTMDNILRAINANWKNLPPEVQVDMFAVMRKHMEGDTKKSGVGGGKHD